MEDIYTVGMQGDFENVRLYDVVATPSSDFGLNNSNVQKVIHSTDLHFDLVLLEDFYHESWLMFAYKFNAPVITICKFHHLFFVGLDQVISSYFHWVKVLMVTLTFSIEQWEC